MKKVFLYALAYLGITATVATSVAVIAPAINKTNDKLPDINENVNPSNPTPEEDEEEEEEEELLPPTDDELFLNDFMSAKQIAVKNLSVNIVNNTETYDLTVLDSYLSMDITNMKFAFEGNLNVKVMGLDLFFLVHYIDDTVYMKASDPIKNNGDYLLQGKIQTNSLMTGITSLLNKFNVQMPSIGIDPSTLDVNKILESISAMTFEEVEGTPLRKATLNLLDLVNIDLYVEMNGTGFDKTVSLKKAVIKDFELNGLVINVDASLDVKAEEYVINNPETASNEYPDYSRVFDIIDSAYELTKQRQFSLDVGAIVKKDNQDFLTLDLGTSFDIDTLDVIGDAVISYNNETYNLMAKHEASGDVYFDFNQGYLKGRLPKATLTSVLDLIKQKTGTDAVASIKDAFNNISSNPFIQQIVNGNYEGIQQLLNKVELKGDTLNVYFNPSLLGLQGEDGFISIDVTSNKLNGVIVNGLSIFNKKDNTTYSIDLVIKLNEFKPIPTLSKEEYPDYTIAYNIFEEIMALTSKTQLGFDVHVNMKDIVDGVVETGNGMNIDGQVHVDLTKAGPNDPSKSYNMKAYVNLEISDVDVSTKVHQLILQIEHDTIYMTYLPKGGANNLSVKIDICTIQEIVTMLTTLIKEGNDSTKEETFLVNLVNNINQFMEISSKKIDTSKIGLSTLKQLIVDDVNNTISTVIDGSFLNINGNIALDAIYSKETGLSVKLKDFQSNTNLFNVTASVANYDATLLDISKYTYYDFNSLKTLIALGLNNVKQNYTHLKGNLTITVLLTNLEIPVDIYIYMDGNNKVSAEISLPSIPVLRGVPVNNQFQEREIIENGHVLNKKYFYGLSKINWMSASIFIKDDMVYLSKWQNENQHYLDGTRVIDYVRNVICTRGEFEKNLVTYLCDVVLNLSPDIMSSINGAGSNKDPNNYAYETLLTKFNHSSLNGNDTFEIGVNLQTLMGTGKPQELTLKLNSLKDEATKESYFNQLQVTGTLFGVLDINLNVSMDSYGKKMPQSEIDRINERRSHIVPLEFQVGDPSLHMTASHRNK